MIELIYKVAFLSDIVLQATSNNEGKIEVLDFVPGSNFLGMVAKNYGEFQDSFAVFHSGAVKFGDATILQENKPTFKMPLSFFHEKLDDKTIYNHHKIKDFSQFKQLKQKRNGYITKDLEFMELDYNYSQKSAYDKQKRRSLDSAMYGYKSLPKGTIWKFSIKIDEGKVSEEDITLLKQSIIGTQRLGKSKSAQYGLVNISLVGDGTLVPYTSTSGETIIYAKSRIALADSEGNPTLDLKYLLDGLKEENIAYEKTQIKTSTFTPYNGARRTKDYERVCINSGSVIVIKDYQGDIPQFIGAYQSEGFGEILVNPSFLKEYRFQLKNNKPNNDKQDKPTTTHLAKFLVQKEQEQQHKLNILNDVDDFIKKNKSLYSNIKPSQWGKVRSICTREEPNFKEEIKEHISSGVKAWNNQQIDTLLKENHSLEFIKLIAIQMPKQGGKQ